MIKKYSSFLIFTALVGCFRAQNVSSKNIEINNNLILFKGQNYTGKVIEFNSDGQIISKYDVRDGMINGSFETYYESKGFIKSKYLDTSLINHYTLEINQKKSQLMKLAMDSVQLTLSINDLVNYNLGGQKKLAKMRIKNDQGKLKKKDKAVFDQFLNMELKLNRLSATRKSLYSGVASLQKEIDLELTKPDFIPAKQTVYNIENGLKNGEFTKFDEKGKVIEVGRYQNGNQEGEWKYFHSNGNLKAVGKYKSGDGGELSAIGVPFNGREGKWVTYNENGKLNQETYWINGLQDGLQKYYFENGLIEEEFYCQNGKMNGYAKYYYNSGKLKGEGNFKNGNFQNVSRIGIPQDGREGKWVVYHMNGKIKEESNWTSGLLNGTFRSYNSDGTLDEVTNYKNGQQDGVNKVYFQNGKLKEEVTYKNDKKHGSAKAYFENGKLMASATYDTTSRAESHFCGNIYEYNEDGSVKKHLFVHKDGRVDDKKSKPLESSKSNSNHKCSWCGKSFNGLGWTIGNTYVGSPRCPVEPNIFDWGGDFMGWYCSKKCAVENCLNRD
jgi:antitoxin component YwqK of YwqJK toxin-antitoxin module